MTLDNHYLIDHSLVYVVWRGRITLGHIAAGYDQFLKNTETDKITRTIHDLRDTESLSLFAAGSESMTQVVRDDVEHNRAKRRAAFVVPNPQLHSDIVSYLANLNRTPRLHARLFGTMSEALDWLDLPPELEADLPPR